MSLINRFNSIINKPAATPAPRRTEAPQAAAPARLAGDQFVRSTPAAPAAPRLLAPASFAEVLRQNPAQVWNTELTARTRVALAAFHRGELGSSVKKLNLQGLPVAAVRERLTAGGFTREMGVVMDVRTGRPAVNPTTGRPVPMEIWSHPDGGMVRVKPEGDPTSQFRPQPHLSVSVKYPPDASGHDFNNEAFKVDFQGHPLPKWAKDAANPHGAQTPAGKQFLDDLAARTHLDLP